MSAFDDFLRKLKIFSPKHPEEDRPLADDETELIFYDKETGKARVEIVKKSPGRIALEEKNKKLKYEEEHRYPENTPLDIKVTSPVVYRNNDQVIKIQPHYKTPEPEGSDVLSVSKDENISYLHAELFFDILINSNSYFKRDLKEEQLKNLLDLDWIQVNYCIDSRESFNFQVSNKTVEIMTHYFAGECYVSHTGSTFVVITRKIHDTDVIQLPDVITFFNEQIAFTDSAKFDEEDEYWEYLELPIDS